MTNPTAGYIQKHPTFTCTIYLAYNVGPSLGRVLNEIKRHTNDIHYNLLIILLIKHNNTLYNTNN